MSGRTHELKTWPEPFKDVLEGRKRFEFRRDDRGFMVGDLLKLEHWDPGETLGGRHRPEYVRDSDGRPESITVRVTYILHGGRFGLPEDYCVMGIERPHPARGDE